MKFSTHLRACVALLAGLVTGLPAIAALDTTTTVVANLRVEGSYGFIGFAQPMSTCGGRVWVDVTTPLGRVIYSTAMMAFSAGKTVVVRADTGSTRVFGDCGIYDIYVVQ